MRRRVSEATKSHNVMLFSSLLAIVVNAYGADVMGIVFPCIVSV